MTLQVSLNHLIESNKTNMHYTKKKRKKTNKQNKTLFGQLSVSRQRKVATDWRFVLAIRIHGDIAASAGLVA